MEFTPRHDLDGVKRSLMDFTFTNDKRSIPLAVEG